MIHPHLASPHRGIAADRALARLLAGSLAALCAVLVGCATSTEPPYLLTGTHEKRAPTRLVPPSSAESGAEDWSRENLDESIRKVESSQSQVVEQGRAIAERELAAGEQRAADIELEHGSSAATPPIVPFVADTHLPDLRVPAGFSVALWSGDTAGLSFAPTVIYQGSAFPAQYRGSTLTVMNPDTRGHAYQVLRLDGAGRTAAEPLLTGFVQPDGASGRPASLAVLPDGSLIVADDANGKRYRITWTGAR